VEIKTPWKTTGNRHTSDKQPPSGRVKSDGTSDSFAWSWRRPGLWPVQQHGSPLPLLVARIVAQDENDASSANDFALVAHPFDAGTNFHQTRNAFASHLTANWW